MSSCPHFCPHIGTFCPTAAESCLPLQSNEGASAPNPLVPVRRGKGGVRLVGYGASHGAGWGGEPHQRESPARPPSCRTRLWPLPRGGGQWVCMNLAAQEPLLQLCLPGAGRRATVGDTGLSGAVLAQGSMSTSQHHHGQRQREQLELEAGCSHTSPGQRCPDLWLRQPQQQQSGTGLPAGASPCHGQQPRATILSWCAGLSCA